MKWYRKIEAFFLKCIIVSWKFFIRIHESNNIRRKKKLLKKVTLTSEQKKQIDEFYKKNYGKKISYKWHRLYQSYTGKFDYRYVPDYIYTTKLELISNKRLSVLPIENKSMLSNFIRGEEAFVRIPKTYIKCVNGIYFDGEENVINKEIALDKIKVISESTPEIIIKKTTDTNSGRGVRLIRLKNGIDVIENEIVENVFEKFGRDFIVQEKIIPHPSFAALYSGSINTLRIATYRTSSGLKAAPVVMRIGRKGYVDNSHAGGIFIGVTGEGKLKGEAFTEYQERYEKHPVTGIVFENYTIPGYFDAVSAALKMHQHYPMLRFISWDFTVDENNRVVLIEANLHSQSIRMVQAAHGQAFFGEDTAEMLALISKK